VQAAARNTNRTLEVVTSGFASIARLPFGVDCNVVRAGAGQPPQLLQLYEYELSPFCRRVREAITDLDLNVEIYPCPWGAKRTRAVMEALGGKQQFPYMIDPNTDKAMYESANIVDYLYATYGEGATKSDYLLPSTFLTGWMPSLLRFGRGLIRDEQGPAEAPKELLVLYSYDGNQFARLVREVLCELELPYMLISAGKGSPQREKLKAESGKTTVPYLSDPNTGTALGDSEDIIAYLYQTYGQP